MSAVDVLAVPACQYMVVLNVSGQFVNDHTDRFPGECVNIVKTHKRGSVDVSGNSDQMSALLSDAKFYADPWGPDMLPYGLAASAERVVRKVEAALARVGGGA